MCLRYTAEPPIPDTGGDLVVADARIQRRQDPFLPGNYPSWKLQPPSQNLCEEVLPEQIGAREAIRT
jgi:hypothetical protein